MRRWLKSLAAGLAGQLASVLVAAAILAPDSSWAAPVSATPIFVYHRFDPAAAGSTSVTLAAFETQLAWLSQHGYRAIPLRTLVAELQGSAPPSATPEAVITIDDGHKSVYTVLFPIIRERRLPVTLFIY